MTEAAPDSRFIKTDYTDSWRIVRLIRCVSLRNFFGQRSAVFGELIPCQFVNRRAVEKYP